MSHKLARAIEEAAECRDASEALAILDAVPGGWRLPAMAGSLPFRHAVRLAGICLHAGLVEEAAALIVPRLSPGPAPLADALLVDPHYFGQGGHHHQYDRFYLDLMRQAGFAPAFVHPPLSERLRSGALSDYPSLPRLHGHRVFRVPRQSELVDLNALYGQIFGRTLPGRRPKLSVLPTAYHTFIDGYARYLAAAEANGGASLLFGVMQSYYRALRSMDIMVMPYREPYDIRGSGLIAECLRFGIVVVAPQQSTAAQFARRAGAGLVTFQTRSVEAIARAIDEALDHLPALKERSAKAIATLDDRADLRRIRQFIAEART